jgi:hypothetical protein
MVKLGVLDPTQPINQKKLIEIGLVKKTRFGIKILGRVFLLLSRELIVLRTLSTLKLRMLAKQQLIMYAKQEGTSNWSIELS